MRGRVAARISRVLSPLTAEKGKTVGRPLRQLVLLCCAVAGFSTGRAGESHGGGVGVAVVGISVDKPCRATAVIESADGARVCNLISEMPLQAGEQSFVWDLYDVGFQQDHHSPYVRRRVAPGAYRVRGLTYDHITPKYEFSVYSTGEPPWTTDDSTGCWMADHTAPSDALFLPADHRVPWGQGQPMMVLTSSLAESGRPTVYTDPDGRVILAHRLCGKAVARDVGSQPVREHALYFANLMDGFSARQGLYALKTDGSTECIVEFDLQAPIPMADEQSFADLAVRDGIAVVSNSENRDNLQEAAGNLLVVDLRTKNVLASHRTALSRGVCFGTDGRLFALIGGALHRYVPDPETGALSEDTVIAADLPDARRVRCDAQGNLFVGLHGKHHQIRVYSPGGQRLRTIGKPGGEQLGRYDERRMQRPEGFAFDAQGRLWVAENAMTPKRISIWNAADGTFRRAVYGRVAYGGGGAIDPYDPTRFYYPCWNEGSGMLFRLDWDKGTWKPESIYFRCDPERMNCDPPLLKWTAIPIWGVRADGRRFVVVRAGPGFMQLQCTVWNLDGDVAKPVGALGITWSCFLGGDPWLTGARRYAELKARFDAEEGSLGWAWSDLNGDATMDPEEFRFLHAPGPELDGFDFRPDLSAFGFSLGKCLIPPPTFTPQGVPVWDLSQVQPLPTQTPLPEFKGTQGSPLLGSADAIVTGGGWEIVSNIRGFKRDGTRPWVYRVYTGNYITQFPGQVIHGYRAAGPVMRAHEGEAGEVWCTHGLKGAVYLFTTDGLFLRTLGGDMRTLPLWRMKERRRGMPIEGISFEDEDFGITIQQVRDGNIYLVAGKEHSSILRIDGLETVKRRDWGTITVTDAMLAGLPEAVEEWPPQQARKELDVCLGGDPPTVDGRLDEWQSLPPSAWAVIDQRVSAAVRVAGDRLYAAFRTGDPRLLENAGEDPRFAFKTGGALDVCLSVGPDNEARDKLNAGDCRLLVTRIGGKPAAILYRPIAPAPAPKEECAWVDDGTGTGGKAFSWSRPEPDADESCTFRSPIGREVFASVTDVSRELQLAQSGGDYEFSIPFKTLIPLPIDGGWPAWGHQPWREQFRFVVGDLGIIRGNGTRNIQRLCWNNLDTAIVSDIPAEVRLKPRFWGRWNLIPLGNVQPQGPQPVEKPDGTRRGLAWSYWEAEAEDEEGVSRELGGWAFLSRPPKESGTAPRPSPDVRKRDHDIGVRFSGYLTVPGDGWYRFDCWADSGVRLKLGDRVICDVPWWGDSHGRYAPVRLRAGTYPVEVAYWKKGGGRMELIVDWSGPNFASQAIPEDAWSRE